MTARILRIELRRSVAVPVALVLAAVGTALLLTFTEGFAGRWMQLAVAGRVLLAALWPLTLAGGVWMGRRDARSRVGELFATTARPRRQRVRPAAAALALCAVAGYALPLLAGAAWVIPTSGYFPADAVTVSAIGALSLVAAGWLGLAAGRAAPRLVTAPLLAVAAFAAGTLLPDWLTTRASVSDGGLDQAPSALLLTPVMVNPPADFQTITTRVDLVQALWLAAVAASGLLLFGARRRGLALAAAPAVVATAAALVLLPTGGYRAAAAVDPGAVALVCDRDGRPVCVRRAHAGLLPDVTAPARRALTLMADRLPGSPGRAVESRALPFWADRDAAQRAGVTPAGTLVFDSPDIGPRGHAGFDRDPVTTMLEAAFRGDCGDGPETPDAVLARTVAAAWLRGRPPVPLLWSDAATDRTADRAYRELTRLSPDDQRRLVARARLAALRCDTSPLAALLHPGSA
ncbi:hypothetical protein [Mangrovihabitans endophyticus]|uniref:ABC-type transport system involved in multi-copper enzyme maturation, permease component n=1 Tax=Mangrovihabitans endophyticus TaxID=1751298 RepID=A0A8J3C3V8_9ACTN|nr:hypothetical protein [Mangrovihabitans endophyticus]GGL04278.1 hypothetical protein GCM10012284_43650 [Mangrovihabitans endophyticus]